MLPFIPNKSSKHNSVTEANRFFNEFWELAPSIQLSFQLLNDRVAGHLRVAFQFLQHAENRLIRQVFFRIRFKTGLRCQGEKQLIRPGIADSINHQVHAVFRSAVGNRMHKIDIGVPAFPRKHGQSFTVQDEFNIRVGHNRNVQAKLAVFDYIEVFYNRGRRHTSIGGIPPVMFEARAADAQDAA